MFKPYHLNVETLLKVIDKKELPSIDDLKINTSLIDSDLKISEHLIGIGLIREEYIGMFGFSILTKELIDEMADLLKDRQVIEIGCGSGYLAHCFRERHPTINYETLDNGEWTWAFPYTSINHTVNYADFDFSKYSAVIVSWPDLGGVDIVTVLDNLPSGCILLHCGEGRGGCTGVAELYDSLEKNYEYSHELKNSLGFPSIHDTWELYYKI